MYKILKVSTTNRKPLWDLSCDGEVVEEDDCDLDDPERDLDLEGNSTVAETLESDNAVKISQRYQK